MGKDPLHIAYEELTVYYNGKPALVLNKNLLDQQGAWENLELIKTLHVERLQTEELMTEIKNPKELVPRWTEIQMDLQMAWGFPESIKYHRFWDIKGCQCPKLDNDDAYPTGYYVINYECPYHGN